VHGETDEWSHHAMKDIVHHYDWHATLLDCFGLDHTKLIYKRNGVAATLTDGQEAQVVRQLFA
jgi:arylsulfatase A-like enzyme